MTALCIEELYGFIEGYTEWAEEKSTPFWLALCEEAVGEFNRTTDTDYDWHDVMGGYIDWHNQNISKSMEAGETHESSNSGDAAGS